MADTLLKVTADGITYDLNDGLQFIHSKNGGFGLPALSRLNQQGPYQDGVTDLGYRLGARTILITVFFNATTDVEYYQLRRKVNRIFKPRNTPLQLTYSDAQGITYQIDAHYTRGLELNTDDRIGLSQKMVIELYCPEPTWYNPIMTFERFGVEASGGSFTVPTAVPTFFGGSTVNQTKTIQYVGDYQTYPIIQIKGPIISPVIRNLTTNQKLDFTGVTLDANAIWTIDTRYGYKTVKDENGVNKIVSLTYDSDLSDFHIAAYDESADGLNTIQVTGTNANGLTDVYIRYYERFIGI